MEHPNDYVHSSIAHLYELMKELKDDIENLKEELKNIRDEIRSNEQCNHIDQSF